jgi:hypothetical protein
MYARATQEGNQIFSLLVLLPRLKLKYPADRSREGFLAGIFHVLVGLEHY